MGPYSTRMGRASRFVFVEGIMGAGKTTTGKWLAERLGGRFLEEGPTREEPVHPLRVNSKLAHPMAVWEDVSAKEYAELSLGLWRAFAARAQGTTVCDGLLFHGNMTDLLLMDAPVGLLREYVAGILETLRPLEPAVVYLRQPGVAAALRAVCGLRGESWERYQVGWKLSSPYAKRRGLVGFDGLVSLHESYRALCDELFEGLAVPKARVELDGDWARVRREIEAFVG
jgi:hypothetical protein